MGESRDDWSIPENGSGRGKNYTGPAAAWRWSRRLRGLCLGLAGSLALAWLFYRHLGGVLVTWPFGGLLLRQEKSRVIQQAEKQWMRECRDALQATETALRAGYALENALQEAGDELQRLWGAASVLRPRWEQMTRRLQLHEAVEPAFLQLARETGLVPMEELAGLLAVAKRSGGGLADLVYRFATQMNEQLLVETEIEGRLTEKRTEKNIMLWMPPGILAYLQISSPEWTESLYVGMEGRAFMTGCLVVFAAAYWLGNRFLDITV